MSTTIPQALQMWQQRLGRSIHLPTPPACAHLMTLAKTAGIPVGTFFLVSRPLEPGSIGTHDALSGDLCCVYDASLGEAGQREVLQSLLLLIAGVQLHFPPPQTIAQDWEQIQQSLEHAFALAQQWGQPALLTQEDLHTLFAQGTRLAVCHQMAGELVGHLAPSVARRAYLALQGRRASCAALADEEAFAQALAGTHAQEQMNDAVVDVERARLRERWCVTTTRSSTEPPSFGACALPPFPRSARMLRSALARAAQEQVAMPTRAHPSPMFRQVSEEADLATLLWICNGWLIDRAPHAALRLHCRVYGDAFTLVVGAARLYRLSLSYEDAPEGAHEETPEGTQELWALFAHGRSTIERRAIEGAWQRFLLSWLTWSEVQCEELAVGLHVLWSTLA